MIIKHYFTYKGRSSKDFGLVINEEFSFTAPERDVILHEVPGLDGDLIVDNGRLKGFNKSFAVNLFVPDGKTISQVANEISEWLKNDVGWGRLTFSGYPGYYFKAICYESFDIGDILKTFGKAVITFRLKPYKYRVDSLQMIELANGQTLTNPEKRNAKPLIKIAGTGNVTLKNNGVDWLILTAVDGYLTIDSAQMSTHKDGLQQFQKMNANIKPLFPLLYPGENKITWTGTVTKVEITPRWEAVV